MRFFATLIVIGFYLSFLEAALAVLPSEELISALIMVESSNNDSPEPGDKYDKDGNLLPESEWAYGPLQIRGICIRDYNRIYGTDYTAKECDGNRVLSIQIYKGYIDHYARPDRLKREPTVEDMARIWNGGPNGWKKGGTKKYWEKVKIAFAH